MMTPDLLHAAEVRLKDAEANLSSCIKSINAYKEQGHPVPNPEVAQLAGVQAAIAQAYAALAVAQASVAILEAPMAVAPDDEATKASTDG